MSGAGRSPTPPITPAWLRALGLVALAVVLSIWAWWPMFEAYPKTTFEDGRIFHLMIEASKVSVRRYHELPLWHAFDCRGMPLWDHPEGITASPFVWLTLPFSATVTMLVWNVGHVAIGFCGMWLFTRSDLRLGRWAALVAASFWAFGAGHASQYAGEHEALISFLYAPLLLLLWRRAERSWDAAVGCGLVLALMVYDGATYPLPFSVVMLGLETLLRCWPIRRVPRLVLAALLVGLVAATVGASRLLPLADQLTYRKRPIEADVDDLLRWESLRDMYLMRSPYWRSRFNGQQYVFGEYISYIGWMGALLALVGLLLSLEASPWLVAVTVLVFVLMLGHFGHYAPWSFLKANVFPFKQMRVSARFRLLIMIPISAWVALATERLPAVFARFAGPRRARALQVALVGAALLCAGDIVGLGREIMLVRYVEPAENAEAAVTPRFYYGGPHAMLIDSPRMNHAWTGCYSTAWGFGAGAPVWEGDVPQAKPDPLTSVGVEVPPSVRDVVRTPGSFTFDASLAEPGRVLLNSAHDPGWQSNVGAVASTSGGLLAVDLPAGEHHVVVRYWPKKLSLGLAISAAGLAFSLLFLARRRLRRLLGRGAR